MVDKLDHWPRNTDYILFIDESGTKDLNDLGSYPLLSLCGCILSKDGYTVLKDGFNSTKNRFWPLEGFYKEKKVCFVSNKIRNKQGPFSDKYLGQEERQSFYEALNSAIGSVPTTILSCIIDKKAYVDKYGKAAHPPYEIAIVFMLERFCMFLQEKGGTGSVVIEARGKKEDMQIEAVYDELLGSGFCTVNDRIFKSYISSSEYRTVLPKKGIYFNKKWDSVNKKSYVGLELADLCAYVLGAWYLKRELPAFKIIKEKLHGFPLPKGKGLKVFP